ncbi:hypothetical protein PHYBLDRAFT_74201 [Phycomyces blakesleeanus NRRL 1555(-)]|uniref:Uncharacterized protein n=1 Tax=Phycomyces blakesleeanus (strain ATCC 8743b / DSM 1359 / FGSC 10004 / NBRC 33097 / NRRL 1555) TaxID=763407 RepID=A0A162ZHY9_PHYB8|nr:hypothetical protein PHYBLDRAFT_74201 [Phycomyces blakesleeanus NRRL 1555(-)]OAD66901.1 hypothetical protein PHYBLDRAFT_74201 [Phycomyces blakesleeanus NRRL 1555(-)]|eukprot:XP_018284941.1 hypothetical protein PHYBLDRAFT_74201 [Phycomyces blakesleeanus NRRL 1555(-)]
MSKLLAFVFICIANLIQLKLDLVIFDLVIIVIYHIEQIYNIVKKHMQKCIYCLTSVGVTIMTSTLVLSTNLAPYRYDTVYPAMIATMLSQYEYVLICDKSNIQVSGSPQYY